MEWKIKQGVINYLAFFLFVLVSHFGYTQPPCNQNPPPGNTLCDATPICDLNGYCGTTSASYSANYWQEMWDEFYNCAVGDYGFDHGTIENNSFLSFVAGESSISFDCYVYNCQKPVTTKAIQLMIFSAESCNSGPITSYLCEIKLMQQGSTPHNLEVNGLTPGETYYIMIDGYSNQICDYTFVATSGVSFGLEIDYDNTPLCPGEQVTVNVSGGSGDYDWQGDGLSSSTGSTVTITPPSTPGTYDYIITSDGTTTGGAVQCPTAGEIEFTLTVVDGETPVFNNPGPVCTGQNFTLPPTSENGISGTWSPAINTSQTTTYTFTPGVGEDCASSTTLTVEVVSQVTPTFTNPGPICTGHSFTLPSTSQNGVSGTWSPAINTSQTTTYTFTPGAGENCASSATMTVEVVSQVTPTFTNPGPVCTGQNFTLPPTSENGISGTWSPAINASQTTTYTFTPGVGEDCAGSTTMTVEVVSQVTPTFTNPGPICTGQSFTLPSTSQNGISGTWNPAINTSQTTTYTFTPGVGEDCAGSTTMTVEVVSQVTPTFTNPGPICTGQSFTLPPTSENGISGTWSPAINTSQTTTYTFTPGAGEDCASSTTLTVEVVSQVTPTFTNPGPICVGQNFTLPPTSENGISGTWSPAINTSQTTTYTFTPGAGEDCAGSTTMTVEVSDEVNPIFSSIDLTICSGGDIDLPTLSDNGILGTWSPAVDNTQTTEYTFSPDNIGGCANPITITIEVLSAITPTFADIDPICSGGSFNLPLTSNEGISGTWTPQINNTQTTEYFFVPDNGSDCMVDASIIVEVVDEIEPIFADFDPICLNGNIILPSTSENGIYGTWSPQPNNTQTTEYTFTPGPNEQCAIETTAVVEVVSQIEPSFINPGPICFGTDIILPTLSENGVEGTWSPAFNNTQTTEYTFTPNQDEECAIETTLTVVIDELIEPTFNPFGPFCEGTEFVLSTTSLEGISGVWTPVVNNLETTEYTFTPNANQGCVIETEMVVEINTAPDEPIVVSTEASCGNPSTSSIENYDANLTYVFVPSGPFVDDNGEILGMIAGTSYTVIATNGGCNSSKSDAFIYTVYLEADAIFWGDGEGCVPLTVYFQSNPTNVIEYLWDFGDGTTANIANPSHTYTQEGCYDVTLTVVTADGCISTSIMENYICVYPSPIAEFTVSTTVIDLEEDEVEFFNTSTGASSYEWSFGDGTFSSVQNPTHSYAGYMPGNYLAQLVVENETGCTDTAFVFIEVIENTIFYIPNAFTPDGDPYNNEFKPIFAPEVIPNAYEFYIFNRWGELIFESRDVNVGWDGSYSYNDNRMCQDGTYVWKMSIQKINSDEVITKVGHVSLIR